MRSLWEHLELPADRPVVIACPGPGALEGVERVPEHAYVIAVNYGISLPLRRVHEWLCLDEAVLDQPWWEQALRCAKAHEVNSGGPLLRVLSEELADALAGANVGGTGAAGTEAAGTVYETAQRGTLSVNDPFPEYGTLRGNATVLGGALQRVFWGLREVCPWPAELPPVYLLGAALYGGGYYDSDGGTVAAGTPYAREEWPYIETLNALLRVLAGAGLRVRVLSPSLLELPQAWGSA